MPSEIINPARSTGAASMKKTRFVPFPLMPRPGALLALISMGFVTDRYPLVNTIVASASDESKRIESPGCASAMAWRRDPGPSSLVFVTIIVADSAESASPTPAQKATRKPADKRIAAVIRIIRILGDSFPVIFALSSVSKPYTQCINRLFNISRFADNDNLHNVKRCAIMIPPRINWR